MTTEEIIKKLEEKKMNTSVRKDLVDLLRELYHKEYSPAEITYKDFKDMVNKALFCLSEVERGRKIKGKTPRKNKSLKEENEKENEFMDLNKKLSILEKELKVDWGDKEVRKIYERIKLEYSRLNNDEKVRIYPKIVRLFNLNKK